MKYQTPVWLDDIITETREEKDKNREKVPQNALKTERSRIQSKRKGIHFFSQETMWLGHEITEYRIKLNIEKIKTILELKPPTSYKELKSILGAIHYMAKFIQKFQIKLTE